MAAMAAAAARSRAGRPSYVARGAHFRLPAGEDLGAIIFHRCEGMAKSIGFETESFAAKERSTHLKRLSRLVAIDRSRRRGQRLERSSPNGVCKRELGGGSGSEITLCVFAALCD